MRVKLLVVAMLLQLVGVTAFAADPKVKFTFGQEYTLPKKHMDIGFLGNMKNGFIQLSHDYGKSFTMQKFSPALKLSSEKVIETKTMPKGYDFEKFVEWNGKYYLLYTTWDKKAGKEHLFVQQIDVNKGDFTGSAKELIACNKVTGDLAVTGVYQFHKTNKFKINFSSDSSRMFVYVKYPRANRDDTKNYDEYGFWVFDDNFKEIWSKPNTKMPHVERKMKVKDTTIDREGNFLFLARVFNDDTDKEFKDDKPNYHYEIIKFSEEGKGATAINFKFEDKYVSQVTMFEDQNGKIVCAGFYGTIDKNGKIRANSNKVDGSFFLRLDARGNKMVNLHKGFYEIPNEVFKQFESNKLQKKLEKKEEQGADFSALNLRLRNVIFGEDGSLLVVGEEYYYRVVTYTSGNRTYTRTYYYYNDIIAQYIDGNGNLAWTKKVPKRQMGVNNTYNLGYRIMPYNGDNYIFFFDNIKNLNPNPDDDQYVHQAGWGGVLMAVKLDKEGSMKKTKVFDVREIKTQVNVMDADEIGSNRLICRSYEKGTSKICLITVE